MFAQSNPRLDFADTRSTEARLGLAGASGYETVDALEQMAQADAADRTLLRLVMCAAAATLVLALAASLGG
jgi:hypothetical protein